MNYPNHMGGMMPHHSNQQASGHGMQMQNPYHMGAMANALPHTDMHTPFGDSEYNHRISVLGEPGGSCISASAFDHLEELVWLGTRAGYVASFYGSNLNKYTAFRVHASDEVVQILPSQPGVYTLTHEELRLHYRTGRVAQRFVAADFHNMQCMIHTPNNSLLVGGHQSTVFEMDLTRLQPINKHQVDDVGVAIMRSTNRHFLFGDTTGKISLRDPRSLKVENQFQAHSYTLSDFDTFENYIVSCGFSKAPPMRGGSQIDGFLMLYDLRMMRSVANLQCVIEPYYLRFVPSYTSRVFVVSHRGQYQIMDTTAAMTSPTHNVCLLEAATAPISAMDVSSTLQHLVFGDQGGCLHLYSTNSQDGSVSPFNQFSQETTFADVVEPPPPMSMDDPMAVYASVPMPYPGHGSLLSDWPAAYTQRVYREPASIDPSILANMTMSGNIGYSKAPANYVRFPYKTTSNQQDGRQHRGGHSGRGGRSRGQVPASPIGREDDPFMTVPKEYRKVEIKYSKLGVEDFDFRHYNRTHFAGLETHIPNAYCNSMLQVLYFIEPLRATLLNHLCQQEFCLACELGFLFHMLDVSKGMTCQANNFLRAFRTIPEASALELNFGDDDEASKKNLARIIQNWSRFVLQQIHTEICRPSNDTVSSTTDDRSGEPTVIEKLFATTSTTIRECSKCASSSERDSQAFMYNMIYPEAPVDAVSFEFPRVQFSSVVAGSMMASQNQPSFCNKCNGFQPHTQKRLLKNLPDVIGLNCQVDNATTCDFWKRQLDLVAQEHAHNSYAEPVTTEKRNVNKKPCRYGSGCTRADCYFYHEGRDDMASMAGHVVVNKSDPPSWVSLGLAVKLLPDGQVSVTDVEDPYEGRCSGEDGVVIYELLASVAHIREAKAGNNLVSHIHVGEPYHQRKEGVTTTQFYLFNDFSIIDIQKKDAVKFNMEWKWPCALFYVRRRYNDNYKITLKSPFENYESLFSEAALASDRARSVTNIPLTGEEKLVSGDVVGIDAEFVSLNQEESELRSDGTKSTIKPSQMSVARVTCIRGDGKYLDKKLLFKPFMDDYISTQEEVVDYLTQFSGIKPGDLDVALSSKHLTTLKSMYIRLRYMVHKGVIFVGHGLKKDFRVINIVIPPKQVCDTAELFHLHRQRMISLKFLAWYFLGETIQSETHDSTEDAQTALKLYFKYKTLGTDREAKRYVLDLYERGRELNWKIPENAPKGIPGIEYRAPAADSGAAGDQ
ncbi:PAN2-PAN3 deadenylation complex catalytic subunit Pan2-like isoform X2 [Watersipora subatra]|uniref:PAN2-PAN3 deadenylation complex catalytic subunit Pan2-like isoform X2 n=1 Tax=Watersipora subatra TaxID=2589382 RepID=UPI00355BD5D9